MSYFRIDYFSSVLDMATDIIVTVPDNVDLEKVPIVLLLHGLSDNASGWTRYTSCEQYAREYGVILVLPEVQRSFYMNMDYGLNYLDYVIDELPSWIKKTFRFSGKWYVMGLSMGGYGAMKCALLRPDFFNGCGAFSSVCDIKEWFIEHDTKESKAIRENVNDEDDLYYLFKNEKKCPKLFFSCGTEDKLYSQNKRLGNYLKNLEIECEQYYAEGNHSWRFWNDSLLRAFSFFFGK